jgi:hypothetical protein
MTESEQSVTELAREAAAKAFASVSSGQRAPRPGERCTCGRPAAVVYITEKFGDVGYCGIPDGGSRS